MHTTGHYGVANSYALKMAEVSKATKDPPVGTIDRDAQGNPTGVMKEAAMGLVTKLVPPFTREQQRQGLIRMIEDFNKEGMTGAKDPGIGEAKWELYKELLGEGKLTVRMFALWSGARRLEDSAQVLARVNANPRLPASLGDGVLFSGGVKMFMDGSGGARTAWMQTTGTRTTRRRTPEIPAIRRCHLTHIARSSPRCTTPAFTSARTRSAIARSTGWSTPMTRRSPRSPFAACGTASSTTTRRPTTP